jgi:hypothetical protein
MCAPRAITTSGNRLSGNLNPSGFSSGSQIIPTAAVLIDIRKSFQKIIDRTVFNCYIESSSAIRHSIHWLLKELKASFFDVFVTEWSTIQS